MTRKTPLRSKKPLKRNSRLRPASKKREKEYREYKVAKAAYIALHPKCECCKVANSADIHHKAQRHGNLLCDTRYYLAVCRACHDFIHQNGKEAREKGWLVDLPTDRYSHPTF